MEKLLISSEYSISYNTNIVLFIFNYFKVSLSLNY